MLKGEFANTSKEKDMLTGKFQLRVGFLSKIEMYVEDEHTDGNDPYDTRLYRSWRKATKNEKYNIISDLQRRGVCNFT